MAKDPKKKSLFDKAVDALTDRDEKAAAVEKAAAEKAAADQAAAAKAFTAQVAASKAAAEKAAAEKAAAEKAAAEKAAADKIAAQKAASEKSTAAVREAAAKAQAERQLAAAQKAAAPKKGIVNIRSLYIRKDHTTKSEAVGGLVRGNEVTIYETWTDGKDTWARIGTDQWSAMIYGGETYIVLKEE